MKGEGNVTITAKIKNERKTRREHMCALNVGVQKYQPQIGDLRGGGSTCSLLAY